MRETPIDKLLINPLNKFINNSTASGALLFGATLLALIIANSGWSDAYHHLWHEELTIKLHKLEVSKTLHHWINDGLMAVFFFVIGLEIKRELIGGELSNPKDTILPFVGGLGGMVVPALFYVLINKDGPAANGWGVPMATDIAFVLAILYLLGDKIPLSLKIFLTALSIADDLGAVLVIAIFYTSEISMNALYFGIAFLGFLIICNKLGVRSTLFYAIFGLGGMWLAFSISGIHATIAGLLTALIIPANVKLEDTKFIEKIKILTNKFEEAESTSASTISGEQLHILDKIRFYARQALTPLQQLEHTLHPIVSFVILPIFAFANAGITIPPDFLEYIKSPVSLGIIFGALFGKTIGISLFCRLLVFFKIAKLPDNINWRHIYGASLLAAVGFSMSLFIADLAFLDKEVLLQAKIGIFIASIIGGIGGFLILKSAHKKQLSIMNIREAA